MVDEQLRALLEEVRQGGAPLVRVESILLVDPNPRQLLPLPRQLVTAPRELLLRLEQLEPRCEPFFPCPGLCAWSSLFSPFFGCPSPLVVRHEVIPKEAVARATTPTRSRAISSLFRTSSPSGARQLPDFNSADLVTAYSTSVAVVSWGVFQHFYPYFEQIGADWPGALRRALTSAAAGPDEASYVRTLRRLLVELQDGHAGFSPSPCRCASPSLGTGSKTSW